MFQNLQESCLEKRLHLIHRRPPEAKKGSWILVRSKFAYF